MTLSKSLLKIIQETNDITTNPLLNAVDLKFIREMEKESSTDTFILEIVDEMEKLIRAVSIQDLDKLREIYSKYGETKFYKVLKNKFKVTRVRKQKKVKTPDFKIICEGKEFYAEVKSFIMAGGNLKYKTTMSNGMNVKIDTEEQLTEGKHIGIGEQIIKPHAKKESDYESDSIRTVIENLIAKFSQNYKVEQYTMGDTISLVYLNEHNFPLYSFGTTMQKILPFYIDFDRKALVSGELWTAVFGKIGIPIFKPPEFEGASSRDGDLNDNGILITHSAPKAVCFYIEALNRSGVIAALIKHGEDDIKSLISKITNLYNDDQNSRIYHLLL